MAKKQDTKKRGLGLDGLLQDAAERAVNNEVNVAGMTDIGADKPEPSRVGESAPAGTGATPPLEPVPPQQAPPSQAAEQAPADVNIPECVARALAAKPKTLISFTPVEIDTKLAILSSTEHISKKRIVLEALLDYLHKRDLLTATERDEWLQLPKEFGTPAK